MSRAVPRLGRRLIGPAIALGLLGTTGGALMASGAFSTGTTVGGNTVSAGTVDLAVTPHTAVLSAGSMTPGDQVTKALTVSNSGSLRLRYAMRSTTTEDVLATKLGVTIKTGVSDCTTGGFTAGGTVVYGPAALGSVAGLTMLGDPTTGDQPGDRTLAAGTSEVLCVNVSLPLSTDNAYRGKNTTATWQFDAEQAG